MASSWNYTIYIYSNRIRQIIGGFVALAQSSLVAPLKKLDLKCATVPNVLR